MLNFLNWISPANNRRLCRISSRASPAWAIRSRDSRSRREDRVGEFRSEDESDDGRWSGVFSVSSESVVSLSVSRIEELGFRSKGAIMGIYAAWTSRHCRICCERVFRFSWRSACCLLDLDLEISDTSCNILRLENKTLSYDNKKSRWNIYLLLSFKLQSFCEEYCCTCRMRKDYTLCSLSCIFIGKF